MTHTEAIDVLIDSILALSPEDAPSEEQKEAAEAHVAQCIECWTKLSDIGSVFDVVTPETNERMRALFGCDEIAEQLYKVAGLDSTAVANRFPAISAHLRRCGGCRELLADLEEALAPDDQATDLSDEVGPRWEQAVTTTGEQLWQLAGEVILAVREGLVSLVDWPDGLQPVHVGPTRMRSAGSKSSSSDPSPAHKFEIPLGADDFEITVVFESSEGKGATLSLSVTKGIAPFSIVLRKVESDREQLIASRQGGDPSEEFIATGLGPGQYHLVVGEQASTVRYRISFRAEANS